MHHLLVAQRYCCSDFLRDPCGSGVVGEAEEFDGARLSVVVVLPLLVITGVGQQRPLWVPGHSKGRRVALNLPQLLSYKTNHNVSNSQTQGSC